jgi:hypothetical protein
MLKKELTAKMQRAQRKRRREWVFVGELWAIGIA